MAYGQAVVLDQSTATQINVVPPLNFGLNSNLTIEGFFMLQKTQLNAILVQLAPNVGFNLTNGILRASLGPNTTIVGTSVISTDHWHHLSFVYNVIQQTATLSIDGSVDAMVYSVHPTITASNTSSTIIIGAGFQGSIDQLSISFVAKPQAQILWDATTAAYYRLDGLWLQDSGPDGLNATASNVRPVYGWRYNALNFNLTDATYRTNYLTALGTPNQAFSISIWVRAETRPGVFLTVSNAYTCLLVLGLKTTSNILVAYLPNATATGANVNIIGPQMPLNAWVNVVFTWSSQNRANLYTSSYLQASSSIASTLTNAHGGNNSLPMTVTLGVYNGSANCQGIQGVDTSQQFMGSLDELYIFARELQYSDIQQLIQPLPI